MQICSTVPREVYMFYAQSYSKIDENVLSRLLFDKNFGGEKYLKK